MITDFYSRLKKLFTDSSLQSKLVWIYFLLIILPLGFFTFYAVHQLSALVKKQTLASVHKAFDNTADAVEGELGRLGSVLDILTMDQIVYQVSSQEHSDYSYTRRLADSTQLATTFEHLRLLSGVSSIRMYVKMITCTPTSNMILSLSPKWRAAAGTVPWMALFLPSGSIREISAISRKRTELVYRHACHL